GGVAGDRKIVKAGLREIIPAVSGGGTDRDDLAVWLAHNRCCAAEPKGKVGRLLSVAGKGQVEVPWGSLRRRGEDGASNHRNDESQRQARAAHPNASLSHGRPFRLPRSLGDPTPDMPTVKGPLFREFARGGSRPTVACWVGRKSSFCPNPRQSCVIPGNPRVPGRYPAERQFPLGNADFGPSDTPRNPPLHTREVAGSKPAAPIGKPPVWVAQPPR